MIGNNMNKTFQKNKKSGFALFVSVIIATTVVSIGFIITSIALSETKSSIAKKESEKAYYNAQTGIECLRYHFAKNAEPTTEAINCGEGSTSGTSYAYSAVNLPGGGCVDLVYTKNPTDKTETFQSLGYNSCKNSDSLIKRGITEKQEYI